MGSSGGSLSHCNPQMTLEDLALDEEGAATYSLTSTERCREVCQRDLLLQVAKCPCFAPLSARVCVPTCGLSRHGRWPSASTSPGGKKEAARKEEGFAR